MTREQAKREIDSLDFYLQNHTDDYGEESHTAMMMAIKALEQQTCEDAVSRQAVLDAIKENTFRLTFAEEQNCEGHVAWSADAVYINVIEGVLLALPPVNPQRTGHWIFDEILDKHYYCSECKSMGVDYWDYCPNCGAKMIEPQERSDEE